MAERSRPNEDKQILTTISSQNALAFMPRGVFQVAQVFVHVVKPHAGSLQRKLTSGNGDLMHMIESLESQVSFKNIPSILSWDSFTSNYWMKWRHFGVEE